MALDPQAANVIDLIIKSGRPAYHTLSPKEARRLFLETRPASTPPAPQIGAVRDVSAEGPLGTIPLRVYRPAGVPDSRPLPVLVFFHGGGWVIGDIETHDVVCRQVTAEAGISVISVDYRLGPGNKFPARGGDAGAGPRWVAPPGAGPSIASPGAPALVITAGFDPLRDEGQAYALRLSEAGVSVDAVCFGGMIHGFVPMGRLIDTSFRAVTLLAGSLRQALR